MGIISLGFEKVQEFTLVSQGSGATLALGRWIGERLFAGAFVALTGDLGAGKSTLARGVLTGLGIYQQGGSPTFTLLWEYPCGRLPAYHWDVYRIDDPLELEDLGYEESFFSDVGVCIVEWAEKVRSIWPPHFLQIRLDPAADGPPDQRILTVRAVGPDFAALAEELRRAGPWS